MEMQFRSATCVPIAEIEPGLIFKGRNGLYMRVLGYEKEEDGCKFYGAAKLSSGNLEHFSENARFPIVDHVLMVND